MDAVAAFKSNQGVKELSLPSIQEVRCVLNTYLGIFANYTRFMRKGVQENVLASLSYHANTYISRLNYIFKG